MDPQLSPFFSSAGLMRRTVVPIWMLVATAALFCLSARASDNKGKGPPTADGATLTRVLANWKARQERVKSLHFVWDSRFVLSKGAEYWQASEGRRVHRRASQDFHLDIPHTEAWVQGEDRFRTEFSVPQFDDVLTLGSRYRGTLDAKTNATLELPREDLRPRATLWKDHYDHESTAPLLRVLLLGCRPGDWRATGTRPELFAVLTEHAIIDKVHCVKLEKSSTRNRFKETCWVDPRRDDVVIRWEIGDRGRPDFWAAFDYQRDQEYGWLPVRWKSNMWAERTGGAATIESTVVRYTINEKFPPDTFAPTFPEGAIISE